MVIETRLLNCYGSKGVVSPHYYGWTVSRQSSLSHYFLWTLVQFINSHAIKYLHSMTITNYKEKIECVYLFSEKKRFKNP